MTDQPKLRMTEKQQQKILNSKRSLRHIDDEGDFVSNKDGEWVIYADSLEELVLKCRNITESARPFVEKLEIEELFTQLTSPISNEAY